VLWTLGSTATVKRYPVIGHYYLLVLILVNWKNNAVNFDPMNNAAGSM